MLERLLGQNVDGLIFVVEEQQPYYDGWPAARAVVRNFPIAAAFADPNPIPDFGDDRFRLVYIGALFKRRGIMVLLESLTQVVAQVPETLLSTQFRTRVERFILDHNLTANVLLLGRVEYTRLKDILAGSDVAWLPGLQVQQYQMRSISTKLLECMLMGLPIVSSDHPHRREFVAQAGCGLLVAAADPQAHAEAILWLYRHPEERKAMGQRGRQLVDNSYTWERETLALLSFYDRLLTLEAT